MIIQLEMALEHFCFAEDVLSRGILHLMIQVTCFLFLFQGAAQVYPMFSTQMMCLFSAGVIIALSLRCIISWMIMARSLGRASTKLKAFSFWVNRSCIVVCTFSPFCSSRKVLFRSLTWGSYLQRMPKMPASSISH